MCSIETIVLLGTMKKLSSTQFQNQLLHIMDQKNHWAWKHFSGPSMNKAKLKVHYQQEYAVYVRDFPVFLARIYGNNPPLEVRGLPWVKVRQWHS